MVALFSIKPEYVEKIFAGEKLYEYRRVIFKQPAVKIVVYATMPVGKIIGEFAVDDVLVATPDEIWNMTKSVSGVDESFFKQYFQDRTKAYAIKIGATTRYNKPINPKGIFHQFTAPQSFRYLAETEVLKIGYFRETIESLKNF